jgi:hypothetical protein
MTLSIDRFANEKAVTHGYDKGLLDYFDRISIVHLRARADRYGALVRELRRLGIEITHAKVCIPDAPMPREANEFANKGVYG